MSECKYLRMNTYAQMAIFVVSALDYAPSLCTFTHPPTSNFVLAIEAKFITHKPFYRAAVFIYESCHEKIHFCHVQTTNAQSDQHLCKMLFAALMV